MESTKYILNVQEGSAYAKQNGKEFELVERVGKRITLNVFGISANFTDFEATQVREFACDLCGEQKRHVSNWTTGYGTDSDGKKVCFDCCGKRDEQALASLPIGERYTLYLCKDADGYTVSNWCGTFWRRAEVRKGRHNIARTRYDAWFSLNDAKFHAVAYGDWTQICHVRKVKG